MRIFMIAFGVLILCLPVIATAGGQGSVEGEVVDSLTQRVRAKKIHFSDSTTIEDYEYDTQIYSRKTKKGGIEWDQVPQGLSYTMTLDPDSSYLDFAFGDGYGWDPDDTAHVISHMSGSIQGIYDPDYPENCTHTFMLYCYSHDPFAFDPAHGYAYLDSFTLVQSSGTPDSIDIDFDTGTIYYKSKFLLMSEELKYADGNYLEFTEELTGTITYDPTAIDLCAFNVEPDGDRLEVTWITATEIDNAGFNLYRGTAKGMWSTRLTEELIPARGNEVQGATYTFTDYAAAPGVVHYYWLEDVDLYGKSSMHGPVGAAAASAEEGEVTIPDVVSLDQNYPNPFGGTTRIAYGLPVAGHVTLSIYNVMGQRVRTLVDTYQQAGYREVHWDGRDEEGSPVSEGIYFYGLKVADRSKIRKMIFLR
jgi:hypothetical protein